MLKLNIHIPLKYEKSCLFLVLFIFLFLSQCKKPNYAREERARVGIGSYNAFVHQVKYIGYSGNELFVDLDVGVVGTGWNVDMKWVPDSAFVDQTFSNNKTIVQSVERLQLNENKSYSNTLVFDQSDDFNSEDIMNLRTRAIHKTILETLSDPNNNMALGYFARDLGHKLNYWQGHADAYQQTYEEYGKILMQYYFYSGTTSNLYDALNSYLDEANSGTQHSNKHITVVIRNIPDSKNSYTATQIINKAKTLGIKINMIFLNGRFTFTTAAIALRTGGFLNIISSTDFFQLTNGDVMDKGTPMLGSIHRPLSNNIHVYRLHLKLLKTAGTWYPGAIVYDAFQTNLEDSNGGNLLNNYIPYYVQIP